MLQNTNGTNKDFIIKTNGETRFFDNDWVERAAIDNDTGDMQIDGDLTVSGNDIKGSGGTAITMDASNNVALAQRLTIPNQPAFLAYITADQTLTGGGNLDKVQFNAEAYDIANNFNPTSVAFGLSGNTYSFTAPVAGRYLFATSVRIDDVANNSTQWAQGAFNNVTTGRSYRIGLFDYDSRFRSYVTVAGSVIMDLAASDVVSVTVGVSSGASSDVFGQSTLNGAHRSFFSGYFLG